MRTTIRLEDSLLAEAKRIAAENDITLTSVIENALRQSFAHQKRAGKRGKVRFTTSGKGGLRPGVDLDDSAALLDLMEQPHDSR
jgi:putative antitoxin of VapBC-like toxin-antitoxin system